MAGEKTKKPTQKKIRDSRKKGEVARVPTICKLLSLIGVLECALSMRGTWLDMLRGFTTYSVSMVQSASGNSGNHALVSLVLMPLLTSALGMCLAAMAIGALLALIGNIVQTGLVFSPEAIPKTDFLDPTTNITQMFSPEQLLNIPLNVIKVVVIGMAVFSSIATSLESILHVADGSLENLFNLTLDLIGKTERSALAFIFVCVLLDWVLRRHFHAKEMMMSQEELDRENKDQYGSPEVRSARRKLSNELLEGEVKKMRKADVVVTNPTHFAIALMYSPRVCPLPVVIVRASGEAALQVIATAKQSGIPVVRSVWLARTLYAVGREGKVIPRLTLRAVAAVYRTIIQMTAQGVLSKDVIDLEPGKSGNESSS